MAKINYIPDEELVTEKDQTKSKIYLEEIEKVQKYRISMKDRKKNADERINKIKIELAELDKQYILEDDAEKAKEISTRKKEKRFEIDDLETIKAANYTEVIEKMLYDTKRKFRNEADLEDTIIHKKINTRISEYEKELQDFTKSTNEKIQRLNIIYYNTAFIKADENANSLTQAIVNNYL